MNRFGDFVSENWNPICSDLGHLLVLWMKAFLGNTDISGERENEFV